MNRSKNIRIADGWIVSLLLGLAFWLFYAVFYRHHLHYQEQLQLFLFTFDYFREQLVLPGGLAGYIGGFFTQLFYDSFLGGLGLAFLLVLLQRLVQDASYQIAYKSLYRFLTCIPSLLYGWMLCHEDVLVSGLVALILPMLAIAAYNRINMPVFRLIGFFLMIPALYWTAGLASLVFPLYGLLREWMRKEESTKKKRVSIGFAAILVWMICPYVAKEMIRFYPVERFWLAGNYHRFMADFPVMLLLLFLVTACLPFVFICLPDIVSHTKRIVVKSIQILFLLFIAVGGVMINADWNKEEIMAYNYYARMQKWNSIIALADKKTPDGPLTVSTLNMALCQKDYLPEYMFTYFQNGPEGLVPDFNRDFNSLMMTGEIYYHLGLINTAQQYAFEAMEAIPDYQKSVRCIKRLAETNLINGQYKIAAKYLELLTHTLFYRKWALETLACLGNEAYINNHPEWGKLRQLHPEEDFLFSDHEKDMMFGLLYQQNPSNKMAYEYLLAYTLLTKDLPRFADYFQMGRQSLFYQTIPRSYQEALALIWSLSDNQTIARPAEVSELIWKKLELYRNIYTSGPSASVLLKEEYGDTYWYYYHFRRTNNE